MGKVKRELFEPTQYVFDPIIVELENIFEQFERAEFELDLALTNWKYLKDKINKD
jgi:exonuclease VII small subunit